MSATPRSSRPRRLGRSVAAFTRPGLLIPTVIAALIAPLGVQAATATDEAAEPVWTATPTEAAQEPTPSAPPAARVAPQPSVSPSEEPVAPAPSVEAPAPVEPTASAEPAAPSVTEEPTSTAEVPAGDEGETAAPEPSGAPADELASDDMVSPMAVPPATGNNAVITVKTGADRTSNTAIAPLAGVTLRLHSVIQGGNVGPALTETWATCVSDAAGDCSFVVPETQSSSSCGWFCVTPAGVNHNRQFFIVQVGTPTGWFSNPSLRTGSMTNSTPRPYAIRTGSTLTAGQTYSSGSDFMTAGNSTNGPGSSGTWQNSRNNPALTCGPALKIALVLDLSGSVDDYVSNLKTSAKGLVDGLAGTNTSLALFTFAETAPRNNTSTGQNHPLRAIDQGNNLATIKSNIDAYSTGGGTNWDRGIWQVAQSATQFDIAIVVTDGMATFSGSGTGPGNYTRFLETEQAIFSASALKAQGTRILAVGVGAGVGGDPANLASISGPIGYGPGVSAMNADYFQTDWQQLQGALADITRAALCQATVEVTKLAQPWGQQSPQPASGWPISMTATSPATFTPGGGTTYSATTGSDGKVSGTLAFPTRNSAASTVTISETLTPAQISAGWSLDSVTCTVNGQGRAVTVNGTSVQVSAGVSDDVECTFINVQTRQPGIEVVKRGWNTDSAAAIQTPGNETAAQIAAGSTIPVGSTVTWSYDVKNTGQTVLQGITVVDDQLATSAITCPSTTLAIGQSMRCTATGIVTAQP